MLDSILITTIDSLTLRHLQLVSEIPLHDLQLRHAQHVAVRIVTISGSAVGFGRSANGRAAQAIALLTGFEQAGLVISIAAGPSRIGRAGALVLELTDSSQPDRRQSSRCRSPWHFHHSDGAD